MTPDTSETQQSPHLEPAFTLPSPPQRALFEALFEDSATRPEPGSVARVAVILSDSKRKADLRRATDPCADQELERALAYFIQVNGYAFSHYHGVCSVFQLLSEIVDRPPWQQVARLLFWALREPLMPPSQTTLLYLVQTADFTAPLRPLWAEALALGWDVEVVLDLGDQLDRLVANTTWTTAQQVLGPLDSSHLDQLIQLAGVRAEQSRVPRVHRHLKNIQKLLALSQKLLILDKGNVTEGDAGRT